MKTKNERIIEKRDELLKSYRDYLLDPQRVLYSEWDKKIKRLESELASLTEQIEIKETENCNLCEEQTCFVDSDNDLHCDKSKESEQPEVTDEMIEDWANNYTEETYHEPELVRFMQYGCFIGAKAMRDGKITKLQKK